MRKIWMRAMAVGALAMLSACGGGGGGDSEDEAGEEVVVPAGPMDKYLGSYAYCGQDHTRYSLTVRKTSDGIYEFASTDVTYENIDCTGGVLGTLFRSPPPRVRYLSTDVVTARVDQLPASLTVDLVRVTWINGKRSLEGPGVTGNCISYLNGRVCYSAEDLNQVTEARLYVSSTALYVLKLENGSYVEDETFLKVN